MEYLGSGNYCNWLYYFVSFCFCEAKRVSVSLHLLKRKVAIKPTSGKHIKTISITKIITARRLEHSQCKTHRQICQNISSFTRHPLKEKPSQGFLDAESEGILFTPSDKLFQMTRPTTESVYHFTVARRTTER